MELEGHIVVKKDLENLTAALLLLLKLGACHEVQGSAWQPASLDDCVELPVDVLVVFSNIDVKDYLLDLVKGFALLLLLYELHEEVSRHEAVLKLSTDDRRC